MSSSKLDQFIVQVENFTECWKQLSHYLEMARSKKFDSDAEAQFLEYKCIIAQELESIMAQLECTAPTKEEMLHLLVNCPSIRALADLNENALRGLENQWHRIYLAWHSNLGQIKVSRNKQNEPSGWSLFKTKKSEE